MLSPRHAPEHFFASAVMSDDGDDFQSGFALDRDDRSDDALAFFSLRADDLGAGE